MDKILSFKVFETSSDFEDWQRSAGVNVCSISPISLGMGMDIEQMTANAETHIGAFVVYVPASIKGVE